MSCNTAKVFLWSLTSVAYLSLGTESLWAADREGGEDVVSPRINEFIENWAGKIIRDPQSLEKEDFREIETLLTCLECNRDHPHHSPEDQRFDESYHPFLSKAEELGYSGAKIAKYPNKENPSQIIKIFEINDPDKKKAEGKKEHALRELAYSLITFQKYHDLNKQLKMVKIYHALICKDAVSFVMETAQGHDIDHWMKNEYERENAIKAYAKYLAMFHVTQRKKIMLQEAQGEYLRHAATSWRKLFEQQDKGFKEQKDIKLFRLNIGEQIKDHLKLGHLESDTIILKLSKDDQEKCVGFIKRIADLFEGCSGYIYRALKRSGPESKYWTTITHGDAHRRNFFYNNAEVSGLEKDSLERITMIDYASSVETYGSIGDPAEDVGRFLGSLWDWASERPLEEGDMYGAISHLQNIFIKNYSLLLEDNNILNQDFFDIFTENCNFYKLRYYRTIFNSPDHIKEDDPKVRLLKYWMKEMEQSPQSDFAKTLERNLEKAKQFKQSKKIPKKQEHLRKWKRIQESKTPDHNLQEREWVDFFIESIPKGSKDSYLTQVWKKLHTSGTATLTDAPKAQVPIAGMGGIGKTSLALEYARESLEKGVYNLIWWLPGENPVFSLKREYEEILAQIGRSDLIPKNVTPEEAIKKMKTDIERSRPPKHRWLLIYDNAQNSKSLDGMILAANENIHVLITSRNQEWGDGSSFALEEFSPKDSEDYLLAATGLEDSPCNRNIAGKVAEELGYLPLALSMAASYINLIWDGCPVEASVFEEYLKDFTQRNPFAHDDPGERLVGTTYDMLEEELGRDSPVSQQAKDMMAWCAYLNPDLIPESIFLEAGEHQGEAAKALKQLYALSLIKKSGEGSFSVHRLVQRVILKKQVTNNPLLAVSRRIETLFHEYAADDGKFAKILTFLPHVMTLLEHSESDDLKQSWDQAHSLRWIGRVLHTWYGKAGIYEQEQSVGRGTHADLSLEEKPDLREVHFLGIKEGEDSADAWIDGQNIHPRIYNALGWMHAKGYYGLGKKDFEKRRDQVLRYLVTSFDKGDLNGPLYMGIIHRSNKNDVEAKSWFNIAAFRGNFLAMHCLGKLYEEKRKYEKAEKWYKKAAKGKNPNAMNNLGYLYQHGFLDEKKQNYQKAMEWYKKAAALRNAPAINSLGCLYYEGQGVKKNDKRALELFQEAAKLGHADAIEAIRTIGNHYVNGKNGKGERITSDLKKAKECFEIAASLGDAEAMNELACFYEKGKGGAKKDKKQAKFWRDKSKQAGYKG